MAGKLLEAMQNGSYYYEPAQALTSILQFIIYKIRFDIGDPIKVWQSDCGCIKKYTLGDGRAAGRALAR